jgi:uncharacterized protein YdeI (YjbR/CyaY-like superfamily)
MKTLKTLLVTTRKEWRAWLAQNHAQETEVWLIFHKKASGKARLPYEDAVEEALCYGWIDSLVRRIDEQKYAQKFTPRKSGSKWSELNKERVRRLLAAGKMTKAGKAVLEKQRPESRNLKAEEASSTVSADVKQAIGTVKAAAENFAKLPPGYLKMCMKWINAAKREETRARRIKEFVELTEKGERIGMK